MTEYIERDAVIGALYYSADECCSASVADIEAIPAADVAEVRHGRWIALGQRTYGGGRSYTHYCSECGQHGFDDYKGCPGCLAKMDLGGADNSE